MTEDKNWLLSVGLDGRALVYKKNASNEFDIYQTLTNGGDNAYAGSITDDHSLLAYSENTILYVYSWNSGT